MAQRVTASSARSPRAKSQRASFMTMEAVFPWELEGEQERAKRAEPSEEAGGGD